MFKTYRVLLDLHLQLGVILADHRQLDPDVTPLCSSQQTFLNEELDNIDWGLRLVTTRSHLINERKGRSVSTTSLDNHNGAEERHYFCLTFAFNKKSESKQFSWFLPKKCLLRLTPVFAFKYAAEWTRMILSISNSATLSFQLEIIKRARRVRLSNLR